MKNTASGVGRFQYALLQKVSAVMSTFVEENKEELAEAFDNHLFRREGPTVVSGTKNVKDMMLRDIFYGFIEIVRSQETLEDVAFYLRRTRFSASGPTPERYVRFHIEAYLSEMYILQQRLQSYCAMIKRSYRQEPNAVHIRGVCESLKSLIDKRFCKVAKTRGGHVHEARYSDADLDRLATLHLLKDKGDERMRQALSLYYDDVLRRIRTVWRGHMETNREALRKLLDRYFDELFPILFDTVTSEFRFPVGMR